MNKNLTPEEEKVCREKFERKKKERLTLTSIENSIGQQVFSQQAKGLTTLNLEGLTNGMYFVTVKSANAVSTSKFVKE